MARSVRSLHPIERDGVLRSTLTKISHLQASTNARVRSFAESLTKRKRRHDDDLEEAAERHARVRDLAESVQARYEEARLEAARQAEEAERQRQAAIDERRRLQVIEERLRIEGENAQRQREIERLKEREEEKRRREQEDDERKIEAERENARRKEQEAAAEAARTRSEAAAQRKSDAEAQRKASVEQTLKGIPNGLQPATTAPQGSHYVNERARTEHEAYLTLHRRLKILRKDIKAHAAKSPRLKSVMGDMRREIVKRTGQISEDKGSIRNVEPVITSTLRNAAADTTSSPLLPVRDFYIAHPWDPPLDAHVSSALQTDPRIPALLLYLMNVFVKALLAQLRTEAALKPAIATNLGILTAKLLAQPDLHPARGLPLLTGLLLAKLHAAAPLLFGLVGFEATRPGRRACGWREDGTAAPAATAGPVPLVSETQHLSDQLGLAAGYAAMTLRSFPAASPLRNRLPSFHYWQAVARLTGLPTRLHGTTSLTVLRGLLAGNGRRILELFGSGGVVLLRTVLGTLPQELAGSGRVGRADLGGPTQATLNSLLLVREEMKRDIGKDVLEMAIGRRR